MRAKQQIKFHKETFEKTTEERRQKILDIAISEFASKGYNAAKINDIAKKAEISTGAMYSYFDSKEDLFLTVVSHTLNIMSNILEEAIRVKGSLFDVYERTLRLIDEYANKYVELNQIYLNLTTQELSTMSARLSSQIEPVFVKTYIRMIDEGKKAGVISLDLDTDFIALTLDNIAMAFQFSFASDYYKERLKIYLGETKAGDTEEIIRKTMLVVRKLLA